jgi:hypothetical protein
MKRIARSTHVTGAVFTALLCVACASAGAGEIPGPIPTAPTLYYACMSTGGVTEYDSTLAEAQAYYDVLLEQARLYTSINGVPSPIVITNWQYKQADTPRTASAPS